MTAAAVGDPRTHQEDQAADSWHILESHERDQVIARAMISVPTRVIRALS